MSRVGLHDSQIGSLNGPALLFETLLFSKPLLMMLKLASMRI